MYPKSETVYPNVGLSRTVTCQAHASRVCTSHLVVSTFHTLELGQLRRRPPDDFDSNGEPPDFRFGASHDVNQASFGLRLATFVAVTGAQRSSSPKPKKSLSQARTENATRLDAVNTVSTEKMIQKINETTGYDEKLRR